MKIGLLIIATTLTASLQAAPITYLAYNTYVDSYCGGYDVSSNVSGLSDPSAPQQASAASGCTTASQAQIAETANTLDLSITTTTQHGDDMWSYGAGGAYLDFTAQEDMTFSLSGSSDASAQAQYLIYMGIVYDLTTGQYVYLSEQISGQTPSEHFDLGGNGGDMHETDPWGNHEQFVFPSEYVLDAGHSYRLQGHVWNQSLAGYVPGWNVYDPGAGSATSTWTFHLESATPAVPEPASLAFMGIGLAAMGLAARRRR